MIDFHCHLDLYPNPQAIVRECIQRSIYVLSVTTTPSAWHGTLALASDATRIRTALGLHPQIAHLRKNELPLFEELLPYTRYVGEIGLDGSSEFKLHWNDQQMVFERILKLCELAGGRILSIHSRCAATAVLDALEEHPHAGTPILHWFSGNKRELVRAVRIGCWFSVGPGMLAGNKGRELAALMPKERVLTETDGPFVKINAVPASPWDTENAAAALASIWSITPDEAREQLISNLRMLSLSLEANYGA